MKAVILAGGFGTRMREETEFRPKPMVEIGGKPVLWHIMKILGAQGISEFIVCIGYKGQIIRDYFLNYAYRSQDFTVNLSARSEIIVHGNHGEEQWKVTLADTGNSTMTGGRVFSAQKYLGDERFLITYGDGLADVNLKELESFHKESDSTLTITAAKPRSRFGVLEITSSGKVQRFAEKPEGTEWVNIGYMLAEPSFMSYLDENSVLEEDPLQTLASENKLSAFKHTGFWQPMDTPREAKLLNDLWDSGSAPWKIWN